MWPLLSFLLIGAVSAYFGRHHDASTPGDWTTLSPIALLPRQEHTTVAISPTLLAVVGGIAPNSSAPGGFVTTPILQLYSIPDNKWRSPLEAAPLPLALNHPNAAAVGGKIYVLGGLAVAADGAWRAVPDSWVYDPATNAWSALEPIPAAEARGSAAVGVCGSTIYLAGGMRALVPAAGGVQDTVDTVVAFDTAGGKWIPLPEPATRMPEGRDHAGAAVVGRTFHVLGGRLRGQVNVKDTVFALDLEDLSGGWTTRKGRMPTPRGGIAAAAVGTKIYTFGGEGNPAEGSRGVFDQTEVYDTETDGWERLGSMVVPRHGTSAAEVGGVIYIPGGGTSQGGAPVDAFNAFAPGHSER